MDAESDSQVNDKARPKLYNHQKNSFYCSYEVISQNCGTFANDDKGSSKTWTRTFVEKFLLDKSWYFPQKERDNAPDNDIAPDLTKAYAYYEHFALARNLVKKDEDDNGTKERSEPGELEPTELYSPLFASSSSLSEFGTGIGLYFNMLRLLALILIIAGLINLPYILYFNSDEYNENYNDVGWTTKGSAVCTAKKTVACEHCPEWRNMGDVIEGNFTVVETTNCPTPDLAFGMVNYATLIFLIICFIVLGRYEKKREIELDEAKQTAQDYSVVVKNPPSDAYDPEEWKNFFSQYTDNRNQVTSISIILNNHQLVRNLTKHRVWKETLQRYIPKVKIDDENESIVREKVSQLMDEMRGERKNFCSLLCGCTLLPILRCLGYFLPPDVLVDKIYDAKEEIKDLLTEKYEVIKVFATFETEAAQRTVLHELQTSKRVVKKNLTGSIAARNLFDENILYVVEAPEPDTVRWLDLHIGVITRYVKRIITLLLTIVILVGAGLLVGTVRRTVNSTFSAYLTVVFNFIIPLIVKLLVLIENHTDESSRQQSLYLKITLFRWVNTAILPYNQTPFDGTITDGNRDLIIAIKNILFADLILSPLLRLLDIVGNVGKHYFAPREPTQERMNLWFQGTNFNLGERYTDFTKILFVVFMYSAVYPTGFFFGAAILFVQYYVDRYCLMRIWKQPPLLGSDLASFSRSYFYPAALLAFGVSSSYIYAQFPFTLLCEPQDGYKKATVNSTEYERMVYCEHGDWSDRMLRRGFLGFPAVPSVLQFGDSEWMTEDQEKLSQIYGWSTVPLLITIFVVMFGRAIMTAIQVYFKGKYKPEGKDGETDFQDVSNISVYIPQLFWGGMQYPVLACDVSQVNKDWIGWNDPADPSYDKHNIIYDFQHERIEKQIESQAKLGSTDTDVEVRSSMKQFNPAFSIVKSWSRAQGNQDLTSVAAY